MEKHRSMSQAGFGSGSLHYQLAVQVGQATQPFYLCLLICWTERMVSVLSCHRVRKQSHWYCTDGGGCSCPCQSSCRGSLSWGHAHIFKGKRRCWTLRDIRWHKFLGVALVIRVVFLLPYAAVIKLHKAAVIKLLLPRDHPSCLLYLFSKSPPIDFVYVESAMSDSCPCPQCLTQEREQH